MKVCAVSTILATFKKCHQYYNFEWPVLDCWQCDQSQCTSNTKILHCILLSTLTTRQCYLK